MPPSRLLPAPPCLWPSAWCPGRGLPRGCTSPHRPGPTPPHCPPVSMTIGGREDTEWAIRRSGEGHHSRGARSLETRREVAGAQSPFTVPSPSSWEPGLEHGLPSWGSLNCPTETTPLLPATTGGRRRQEVTAQTNQSEDATTVCANAEKALKRSDRCHLEGPTAQRGPPPPFPVPSPVKYG